METNNGATLSRRLGASSVLLIAANAVPVVGVLAWGWDLFLVLFLFWAENVVIGAFGIAKLVLSRRSGRSRYTQSPLFYVVHYGLFMYGHLHFLVALFGDSDSSSSPVGSVILDQAANAGVIFALLSLVVSHGWSFVSNFLGGDERSSLSAGEAMKLPYARMMITHVTLLVGGLLVQQLGAPILSLILLLVLKTGIDLGLHRREHRRLAPQ